MRAESAAAAIEPTTPVGPVARRGISMGSLPTEVARQAQRDMDRLRRLPPGSTEAQQVRAYLQWLWSLPWDQGAPEDANLRQVETELERGHHGLRKAKERIVEYLAVRRLKPDLPGPAPASRPSAARWRARCAVRSCAPRCRAPATRASCAACRA